MLPWQLEIYDVLSDGDLLEFNSSRLLEKSTYIELYNLILEIEKDEEKDYLND